jgi:bacterioferritin
MAQTGNGEFALDVEEIRRRARRHIEQAAVTQGYGADLQVILKLLNEALATELICTLRYRRHYFMAQGIASAAVAQEFMQHSIEEQAHADQIAQRIIELDGQPNFDPEGLKSRAHSEYVPGTTLVEMIKEDLVAERIAIQSYQEMIRFIGDSDPTTRRLLEAVLEKEEEHAEDMASLLPEAERAR